MIRKFYFGTSWKDLNGNNVLLLQLPHKGLDGIIFLHEIPSPWWLYITQEEGGKDPLTQVRST